MVDLGDTRPHVRAHWRCRARRSTPPQRQRAPGHRLARSRAGPCRQSCRCRRCRGRSRDLGGGGRRANQPRGRRHAATAQSVCRGERAIEATRDGTERSRAWYRVRTGYLRRGRARTGVAGLPLNALRRHSRPPGWTRSMQFESAYPDHTACPGPPRAPASAGATPRAAAAAARSARTEHLPPAPQ